MQRFRHRLAASLSAAVLLVPFAPAWANTAACGAKPDASAEASDPADTRLSARSERILNVLVSEKTSTERFDALKTYLNQPEPQNTSPEDFVLRNYARLWVGAEYIRRDQYDQARNLLSQARLDSPAGVETALLTAHSWQLQGKTDQALKWYMRVSARYRASPRVLQTVLDRAHEAADAGDHRLATRLYERVVAKALANVRELAELTSSSDDLSSVILDRQSARDSAATVSGQLIRELLRGSSPQALPHLQHVLSARKQLRCLEDELEQLKQEQFQASQQRTQADNFRTMASREQSMIQRRIDRLKNRLETVSARKKGEVRSQLKEQREKLTAVKERQAELKQEAAQSQSLQQTQQQLTQRRVELENYRQENRQAVRREMEQVILRLKRRYLDLAGEGQAGRAGLMRSVALHHTR